MSNFPSYFPQHLAGKPRVKSDVTTRTRNAILAAQNIGSDYHTGDVAGTIVTISPLSKGFYVMSLATHYNGVTTQHMSTFPIPAKELQAFYASFRPIPTDGLKTYLVDHFTIHRHDGTHDYLVSRYAASHDVTHPDMTRRDTLAVWDITF